MNAVLKYALIVLLLANAMFWGLLDHPTHCAVAKKVRMKCVAHWVHMSAGLAFLFAALLLHIFA